METQNDYNFSLFKPNSDYSRRVRNIIISMLLFWVLAVFGFQILLRVIEKPVPEPAYNSFQAVWEKVKTGNCNETEHKQFIQSLVAVLGKSSVKKEKAEVLANAMSWSLFSITDSATKAKLMYNAGQLKLNREKLNSTKTDAEYLQVKQQLDQLKAESNQIVSKVLNYEKLVLEANIVAFFIKDKEIQALSETEIAGIPAIMKTYLIHNRSVLTDTKFLRFPFHYFYSSEFLLILFVLLCVIYVIRIQRLQKKFNIVE